MSIHPSIHCSMGSAPVGVQCPFISSLGEFPGYWDWLWYPGLSSVLVSIAFPFCLPYLGVSPFTLLRLPLNFICVSSLRLMYMLPSVNPSLTYFLGEFPGLLRTGSVTRRPRGRAGVRMMHKSRFKFLPRLGFEPLQCDGCEHYH